MYYLKNQNSNFENSYSEKWKINFAFSRVETDFLFFLLSPLLEHD